MYSVERWIVTVAKILDIKTKFDSSRYKIIFFLENPTMAKQYEISLLGSVREQWMMLDLYSKGNILILDGPIADSNNTIIPAQEAKVNEVAAKLRNTIENDIPGFKTKIERIILFYQQTEKLDIGMAEVLEMGLKGNTKIKFMAEWDYRIFARIIRLAFEAGKCSSPDEFDERVNAMFDNQDLIRSIINDIQSEDRKV